uniref:Secreted protein n=1 Tax=Arundo donax TaxID=35708 RepID=A0A0A9F009_ARUDO
MQEGTPVPFCTHAFLKVIAWNTLLGCACATGRSRSVGFSWHRNLWCRLLSSPWSCRRSEQAVQWRVPK